MGSAGVFVDLFPDPASSFSLGANKTVAASPLYVEHAKCYLLNKLTFLHQPYIEFALGKVSGRPTGDGIVQFGNRLYPTHEALVSNMNNVRQGELTDEGDANFGASLPPVSPW